MPNRNQIIIFSVLGITALLIGYFKNPLNLSMGKRAEAGGPIAPTIVTNVITNLANNIVTNVITNTVPVKPKPNPVKPKANPVKTQPLTPRTLTLEEKKIVGTYERKMGAGVNGQAGTISYVLLNNGIMVYYRDSIRQRTMIDYKWSITENELHIIWSVRTSHIYRINPDNSITRIADIIKERRTDYQKERQATWKKIK